MSTLVISTQNILSKNSKKYIDFRIKRFKKMNFCKKLESVEYHSSKI